MMDMMMNRRSFLRFLGVSPALSVVDLTRLLENQVRPEWRSTMMAHRDDMVDAIMFGMHMHIECIDPFDFMPDPDSYMNNSSSPQNLDGT